ncbi:uncharacterized protein PHACADRAFT_213170 [Phanerochaete carnosa HHB-10118-sp]|uniref:Uncharacterized protein n=1 Tax=Phanerochaete carnosa (strain HHB-10118-sp) TaxID=650164 RepID=K5UNL2_PHACS|nr:uncharacterized protein PHACADRAFT_213170 [Phanerochaete carnosa HHB-10118-sp]EKM51321.1 hypothetical protein PHACADRAFT_213170 [Phanerochaete carnosa HHB-10118-sp]
MSLLARQAATALRVVPRAARASHFDHAHPPHMPFAFGSKATFRAKYLAFVGFGFSLPFVAAYWQLSSTGARPQPLYEDGAYSEHVYSPYDAIVTYCERGLRRKVW